MPGMNHGIKWVSANFFLSDYEATDWTIGDYYGNKIGLNMDKPWPKVTKQNAMIGI